MRNLGSATVVDTPVALLGSRRFWRYRSELPTDAGSDAAWDAALNAAYAELDAEHVSGGDNPVGIVVVVDDAELVRRRPQAVWEGPDLSLAGFLPDGRQVRVRYFDDALIGRDPYPDRPLTFADDWMESFPLAPGYSTRVFDGVDVPADAVIDLWMREGVLPKAEARRRISEVLAVGIAPTGEVVGVVTAFLQHRPQLHTHLWGVRGFVAESHRRFNVISHTVATAGELLLHRWETGQDRRAPGTTSDTENEGMRRMFPQAKSMYSPSYYIGDRPDGVPMFLYWFPRALAPVPDLL